MKYMGTHWHAPRKTNDAAWKKLVSGARLWDTRHILKRIRQYPGRYRDVVFYTGEGKNKSYYWGYAVDQKRKNV